MGFGVTPESPNNPVRRNRGFISPPFGPHFVQPTRYQSGIAAFRCCALIAACFARTGMISPVFASHSKPVSLVA